MTDQEEGVILSREQFDGLNNCNQLSIFTLETDRHLAGIMEEELHRFDYIEHFCYLIDKLYRQFEYVKVTPDNKFYGYRNGKYKFLYEAEGVYEKAKALTT